MLELHRAGRELSYVAFQPRALALVNEIIAFDSAWWGNAAAEPMEIHRLHLHNCADSILQAYMPHIDEDFFRVALIEHPGTTINMSDLITREQFTRTKIYRDLGKRYRIEWSLGTLLVEPVSSLYEFLTLWRHDARKPFNDIERQSKELLMPHVADAHRVARLRAVLDGERVQHDRWAVCDVRGFLREASPGFVHDLRVSWADWQGSRLPEPLLESIRSAKSLQTRGLKLQISAKGDFRYLQIAGRSAMDGLTSREHQIIARYAQGATNARIAKEFSLSPSTVRNHIARCYRKLAVNNKAELALRLAHSS